MRVAIIGASGFVGQQLTQQLLKTTSHQLLLFSHKATKLHFSPAHERRIKHVDGNVLQADEINKALRGCDMAIYLVHLMGNGKPKTDFSALEKQAANNFAHAARDHHIARVIYVGGMGTDSSLLTKHLQSRATTGAIIRSQVDQLIELRTPMIIGHGGAGFEVLASLVRNLPVLPVPRWARATTQPITVHDVVRYILASMTLQTKQHQTIDIGGPEPLTYVQVAQRYAAFRGQRLIAVPLPLVSKSIARFALKRLTSSNYAITVADMIESAGYSTVIDAQKARQLFPGIQPEPIEAAF